MFFTGDFNAHCQNWWPGGDTKKEGIAIDNLTSTLGLSQIICEATNYETNKNPSCIDLIFCDQPNLITESGVRPSLDNFCKHQLIYCKINVEIPPSPSYYRLMWHYNRANTSLIKRAVSNFNWHTHLSNNNPNWQVNFFTKTILNILSNFIPNEYVKVTPKDPPWITNGLKRMIKKQNRQYKNFKRKGSKPGDKAVVDGFRQECFNAINAAKEDYLKTLGNKLNDPNNGSKAYWNVIHKLMNKCKIPKIPPIIVNNKFIINCKEKASTFNKHFSNQCKLNINNSILPPFNFLTNNSLDTISISNEDILNILNSLNPNKSHGPDNISIRMLQLCGDSIVVPLKIIFDNIIHTGSYPSLWKRANVTPIHKKNNKQILSNYRPISLLPICSKIFERIVFKQIYNHLISENLITENQSGFRPSDSTTNQLLYLVHVIQSSFDHKMSLEVRHVFLDMSKAFDKVWHEGLLFKLKQNGISGPLLTLLTSYLKDRKQRVVLNGQESNWEVIESGVPQGSVLGPLLFLIYINDLENGIKSKIKFFADDTSLFSIVNDPILSANELNHDLHLIENWAYQWKMSFNPDPSKQAVEILFTKKRNSTYHPPLFFNNQIVKKASEHKHLGLILDPQLIFSKHLTEKIATARRGIGVLKYLSSYAPINSLNQIYKMYVRPHLDYCDIIYHIPSKSTSTESTVNLHSLMRSVESTQYQAGLAVSGAWKGSSTQKIYNELGWESLDNRRKFRRLCLFYKIYNDLTPSYLKAPIPANKTISTIRVVKPLHDISCRTSKFMNSFYPNSVRLWNDVGNVIRDSSNLNKFKSKLINVIRPNQKSFFGILDHCGTKSLFQIKIGLSPLKSHKKT